MRLPRSQDAMQIVGTLLAMMRMRGVRLVTGAAVTAITPVGKGYEIETPGRSSVPTRCW